MASKITFFFLLAIVFACTTMMCVDAQIFLPCKTTKDCEYLHCSSGTPLCVKRQCTCTLAATLQQAKLNDQKTNSYRKKCKLTSDCDPRIRSTCVSGSYMCFEGYCTCTN
ncbi:unnamed protein product [Cochlearia groenlandica]